MLKAVIFDMDGVIIDSEPLHARAAVIAMKNFGLELTLDYCYSFIGSTAKHMLEVTKDRYHLNATIEELMEANVAAKRHLVEAEGYPPIPYVYELMANLHDNGYLLAIASSSPYEDIMATATRLKLLPFLNRIVSGMQVQHPKPAPDVFLLAAEELGVSPDECVVIEDSCNGLLAARAAGMTRVAFFNPHSGAQDLSAADYVVEGFDEVDSSVLRYIYQHAHGESALIAETSSLIIRELSNRDLPALVRILQEPSVAKYVPDSKRTLAEWESFHSAYISNAYHFRGYGLWGVFEKRTGELIGRCGLEDCTDYTEDKDAFSFDAPEIGYLFDEAFRGRGYATQAVATVCEYAKNRLGLQHVYAVIAEDNIRSLKLAIRIGMKPCGVCKRDGQACVIYKKQLN